MGDKEPKFTGINYYVCSYCSHLIRGRHRDGYREGCGKVIRDGKYTRITLGDELARLGERGIGSVNGLRGCEEFDPSGVPIHPRVLEVLVSQNSLCSQIPSDPNATEGGWDFSDKMNKYLPKESITSHEKIH